MSNFDYTSRDYAAIQADLLARATRQFPEWTSREASDFGMLFVDLWSYMGDVLHYYVDRAAGEAFLNTATQRESVLAIANLLDYVPSGRKPAKAVIQLDASQTTATDAAPIFIPQYTRFLATPLVDTASKVVFTLNNPIAFTGTVAGASAPLVSDGVVYDTYPKTTVVSAVVTEGERFSESYTSTGRAGQTLVLRQSGVVTESLVVEVGEGPALANVRYTYVPRIVETTSGDRVFTVEVLADNTSQIVFGNGVNGKIPTTNATISISYRRSRGSAGNVLTGAIKEIESITVPNKPALDGLGIIPNTVKASGGTDVETISSLRANIPASFRVQDRAVSLQDYEDIVKRVPGIVRSVADVQDGVVIIKACTEPSDYGSTDTLVLTEEQVTAIEDYLEPREITFVTSTVGASVTLTAVKFYADVQIKDGYIQEVVKDNVDLAVRALFAFDVVDFGGRVSLGDIYRTILDVDGVDYAVVTTLTTTGVDDTIDSGGGFTGVTADYDSMLYAGPSFVINPSGGIIASGG